jgi:hypothetical protein
MNAEKEGTMKKKTTASERISKQEKVMYFCYSCYRIFQAYICRQLQYWNKMCKQMGSAKRQDPIFFFFFVPQSFFKSILLFALHLKLFHFCSWNSSRYR